MKTGHSHVLPIPVTQVSSEGQSTPTKNGEETKSQNQQGDAEMSDDSKKKPEKSTLDLDSDDELDLAEVDLEDLGRDKILEIEGQLKKMKETVIGTLQDLLREFHKIENEIVLRHGRIQKFKGAEPDDEKTARIENKLDIVCSKIRKRFGVSNEVDYIENFF